MYPLQHLTLQVYEKSCAQPHTTPSPFTGHQTMNSAWCHMSFSTPSSLASLTSSVSKHCITSIFTNNVPHQATSHNPRLQGQHLYQLLLVVAKSQTYTVFPNTLSDQTPCPNHLPKVKQITEGVLPFPPVIPTCQNCTVWSYSKNTEICQTKNVHTIHIMWGPSHMKLTTKRATCRYYF